MPGRPRGELVLSDAERDELRRLARRATCPQHLALRAKIVLGCAAGKKIVLGCAAGKANSAVAADLGVCRVTVGTWRKRFLARRLDGLLDGPRPGAPRKVSDEDVERVVVRTLNERPRDATHWSTRSMAAACGLSQSAVSRVWRAFALKPHRAEAFKISEGPLFVEKVRDVVGLSMNPPDRALVFCVDEKSQVQALDRSQPVLPMRPGRAERHTHDYFRHGTASLFAALDVAAGAVIGRCYRQHRHQEFLALLRHLDAAVPREPGAAVHLVPDNHATHKTPAVKRWLARRPEFVLHFTPTGASWLNQVERFFAEITTKRIRRGVFRRVEALERSIRDYLDAHNERPKPFAWTADPDAILRRVANICKETSDSGH